MTSPRTAARKRAATEALAEAIAPRAQLRPVVTPDGVILRGARLEAENTSAGGVRIVRRNIVLHLHRMGQGSSGRGAESMISWRHVQCAELLIRDWDECATGVGIRAVNLLEAGGGRGGGAYRSQILALGGQMITRERLVAALGWVGSHRAVLAGVVLEAVPVQVYAAGLGCDRRQMVGYLASALDRLGEFYEARRIRFPEYKAPG